MRAMPYMNTSIIPTGLPILAPNSVWGAKLEGFWASFTGLEQPRSRKLWPRAPRPINSERLLAVPQVHQRPRPRIGFPTQTVGTRVAAQEHVRVTDEEPAVLRQFRSALPQLGAGGALVAPRACLGALL